MYIYNAFFLNYFIFNLKKIYLHDIRGIKRKLFGLARAKLSSKHDNVNDIIIELINSRPIV